MRLRSYTFAVPKNSEVGSQYDTTSIKLPEKMIDNSLFSDTRCKLHRNNLLV